MTFDNKYDAKIREEQIRKFWESEKIFSFDKTNNKPIFSIDTPPPTISGRMHIGHAYSYSQQDFVARYKRMTGHSIYFPFGTDDNGLATEKLVQKEKKVDLRKVDRKEAVKIVLEYLEEERPKFIQDWKNLGMSNDFNLKYSTIDKFSQKISQESFLELVEKGLIERRKGPVMWDRQFQTAIAQAELEDVTRKAYLNYVKAKVEGTESTYMIYATTRPELCFAVVGMSVEETGDYVTLLINVNGKDEHWICGAKTYEDKFKEFDFKVVEKFKGSSLIGQKVKIPVCEKVVTMSHDIAVKADFGTGIAYFCTYGGLEDIEWASRHNVEPIELLNTYGKLSKLGGKYEGLLAEDARKQIISDMESSKVLIKKEQKDQVVNVGERSGVEVEFIVSNQWYVKYLDKKEYFLEMAEKFNWTPTHMKSRIDNWILGLNWDWGFSRQRHFGIPIPAWICKNCSKIHYPTKEMLPCDPVLDKLHTSKCTCGSSELVGETDVFDTWFTSASSAIIASKLTHDDEVFKRVFPMTLRPQGHDIINFWLFYSMAKTNLQYGKNPFRDVNISGWVLAPDGTKMSKSKGNTIAPQEVVSKFSNDALRFAAASTKLGFDIPYQEKDVKNGFAVANKIYNANKFASMMLENFSKTEISNSEYNKLRSIDKWILARLNQTISNATKAFEIYDYAKAKSEFEQFFMKETADNYIEIVKNRLWKPDIAGMEETKKAQNSLYEVLYNSLKGLAPIMPFITEDVYQNFYRKYESESSIHLTSWPKADEKLIDEKLLAAGDGFLAVVGAVRKFKSENQVSQKVEISELKIDCSKEVQEFIEDSIFDMKAVTGSHKIIFAQDAKIETENKDIKVSIELIKE